MTSFADQAESLRLARYNEALLRTYGLKVYVENPFSRNELDVYWAPDAPLVGYGSRIGFNVYRARSPQPSASPEWVNLTPVPVTATVFQDLTVDLSTNAIWWYRVEEVYLTLPSTYFYRDVEVPVNQNSFVNGFGVEPYPDITVPQVTREWRRRKYIMLNRNAELSALLVRKVAGTRCVCFDREYESTQKATDCPSCYGTGWEGGYEVLRDVLIRIVPINESLKLQPDGLILDSNPKFWLVDFPLIRDTDILVRRNGLRYQTQDMEYLTTQGILTEQTGSLIKLESTHVVYGFSITP